MKKLIKKALRDNGFTNKVSQKTIGFQDLARDKKLFIFIHNWIGNQFFSELQKIAKENNFIVSTK